MKKLIFPIAALAMYACSSQNETTETTNEVVEHTPEREAAAKNTFTIAKSDYNLWLSISNSKFLDADKIDQKSKAHEEAKHGFENVVNDFPQSPYYDSAKIYLDSMFIWGDIFLQKNLGN